MKKHKVMALVLITAMSLSAITGCKTADKTVDKADGKAESTANVSKKDTAKQIKPAKGKKIAVAEEALMTDMMSKNYANYDETVADYQLAVDLFYKGERDEKTSDKYQPFIDKHGYKSIVDSGRFLNKAITPDKTLLNEVYQADKDYYKGLSTYLFVKSTDGMVHKLLQSRLLGQIKCYTNDVFNIEPNSKYTLSEDFAKLNPKEHVKKYLEDSDTTISKIYKPSVTAVRSDGAGTYVVSVFIPIDATQGGKDASEPLEYDFHFVAGKKIRQGGDIYEENDKTGLIAAIDTFEIEAITNSHYNEDTKKMDFSNWGK